MLSRGYILVCFVTLAVVWVSGWKTIGNEEKGVLTCFMLAGLLPAMWLDTITRWGIRCLRGVLLMAGNFLRSKRGSTLTGIAVFSLLFLFSPFQSEPIPYRYHLATTLLLSIGMLWLQPPCVLVLGASSRQTGRILASVSSASYPFRVVALLDHRRTGYFLGTFSLWTDNLRTDSDSHWRNTVDKLSDHVPLIVLDARTDTPIVVSEVKLILEKPERRNRTIFVVGPDRQAPALELNEISPLARQVRTVKENEIEPAVREWLSKRPLTTKR